MRLSAFIIFFLLGLMFFFSYCGQSDNANQELQNSIEIPRAEQIKVAELKSVLTRLENKQLAYEFFGITSNGVDCIYFVPSGESYNIEFEVMTEEQKPWFDKLQEFAQKNNYKTTTTTYNNKPNYQSSSPAPVLRIETQSNLDQTTEIGQTIMTKVFGNSLATTYDIVP
ncbi:MAG: hypothetical protein ACO1N7_09395 [Sphingobacteriaceae bacterium]